MTERFCGGIEAVVEPVGMDRLVEISDQPAVHGDAGEHGEIALGDAERHVHPGGIAPLGGNHAMAKHEAVRPLTRLHRAEDVVGRGRLVGHSDVPSGGGEEVPAPRRLVAL